MSIEIDFTYAIDGFYHSVNYYRSESPMNVGAMPPPTATGITGLNYTDTTAEPNKKYYVRFGSVKNTIEKISDEVVLSTYEAFINMPFSTDMLDHSVNNVPVNIVGSCSIIDGALYVPGGSYLTLDTTGLTHFNIGSGDFEFGVEVAMMPTGHGTYPCLFGVGTSWASGAISMQYNPSHRFMCALNNGVENDAFAPSDQDWNGTTFDKYVVRRVSGVVTTYRNNIAGSPISEAMNVDLTRNNTLSIGAALWSVAITSSHSKIRNLYFKKI